MNQFHSDKLLYFIQFILNACDGHVVNSTNNQQLALLDTKIKRKKK